MSDSKRSRVTVEKDGAVGSSPKTPLRVRPAIWLLLGYRYGISPILQAVGVRCRHEPSCSAYAMQAFRGHGLWRGFWLTFSRLSRCHPWGSHGFDPVPESRSEAGWKFWRHGDWAWTERNGRSSEL